jgi:SAM-dependent methyltransferase
MLDVGCGSGTWLSVANNSFKLADIQGVDASIYDAAQFHIAPVHYLQQDLTVPLQLQRTYDLVTCLEVAEHLPLAAATTLVKSLATHGDVILFSAAIPGQGGQHHINEQWQSWWQQHFAAAGFVALDLIRPAIWQNAEVLPWYKQNILLYVKKNHPLAQQYEVAQQPDLVHPEIFGYKLQMIDELARIKEKTVFNPTLPFALKALAKSLLITPFRK